MTQVQINGIRFETNTLWEVDGFTLVFTDADGNPTTGSASDFNPSGPNAGNGNLAGSSISVWTDNQIVVDYDETAYGDFLMQVTIFDVTQTQSVTFDVSPDAPTTAPSGITIANVVPAGPNYIGVSGTDLDTVTRWRVFDNFAFDQVYYDSSGPNAGLNPPGSTVTVYGPTSVIIGDTAMAGLTITQVQARVDPGNAVADEWYGSALVESTPAGIDWVSYTSPASQTLRLEALGGLLSGGAARLSMGFSNGSLFASNPNDPNEATTNAGNGITVITWTDTVVEFTSPFIPSGDALGVAVQGPAPLMPTIDEWLAQSISDPSGFLDFVAVP